MIEKIKQPGKMERGHNFHTANLNEIVEDFNKFNANAAGCGARDTLVITSAILVVASEIKSLTEAVQEIDYSMGTLEDVVKNLSKIGGVK